MAKCELFLLKAVRPEQTPVVYIQKKNPCHVARALIEIVSELLNQLFYKFNDTFLSCDEVYAFS